MVGTARIAVIAVITLVAVRAFAAKDDLTQSYRKEFAFLDAEKRALQKRLKELKSETDQKTNQARNDVDKLERQILGMRAQADDLEMELADVERQTSTVEERTELIKETIERGFESMRKQGFEIQFKLTDDRSEQAEQLEQMFALGAQAIEKSGTHRQEKGEFFALDGTLTKGDILWMGNIAAYGVSKSASGALAPAGAGRLKLWHENAADSAQAMFDGKEPKTLAAFLFETLEKGIEEKKAKTPLEVIQSGGIIAWVIVCLGALGLIMILFRLAILLLASSRTDRLIDRLIPLVGDGRRDEALKICSNAKGAAARVLKATIRNLEREREHLEDIVSEAILHESPFIERFGSTIMVIAAVAPLLGLLGTVTGMISTFDVITEFGTGDPKMLSGGISEALVTTELGLIVAIPTLLIGTLLTGRANAILQTMERAALQLMNQAVELEVLGKPKSELNKTSTVKEKQGLNENSVAPEAAT